MMVHFFDIDRTLVRKPTSYYFLLEALGEGAVGVRDLLQLPIDWLRYKAGHANYHFIEEAVEHMAGIPRTVVEQVAENCFQKRMKRNIYVEGYDLVQALLKKGDEVRFATSAFLSIIEPLERFFGLGDSVCSHLEFGPDDATTGRVVGSALFGDAKKDAVLAWLSAHGLAPADAAFYTDSYTDLPLMELCGKPFAVNPDRTLALAAKAHGWPILRFTRCV
jgi:HAD superfamily hydrolase (TIGR01490 family)